MYDLYIVNSSGIKLATSVAWTSTTSRGTGAGTAQIARKDGIWTNANSMTMRIGSGSGDTITVAANQGTLVGTMYATSNGTTKVMYGTTAAAGGANSIIGLCNLYNTIGYATVNQDNGGTYTYASTSIRNIANSANNRVTWVDCIGGSGVIGFLINTIDTGAGNPTVGLSLNLSGASGVFSGLGAQTFNVSGRSLSAAQASVSGITGLNFLQGVEQDGNTTTYTANYGSYPGISLYGVM